MKLGFGGVWRGFVMHVGGELGDGDWDSGLKGWGLGSDLRGWFEAIEMG